MAFTFDAPSVTMYSNGPVSNAPEVSTAVVTAQARGCRLDTRSIRRMINNGAGPANGITIEFENGPNVTLGMLLDKPPTVNRAQNLIQQLGLITTPAASGGEVIVDHLFGESSLAGCFAAGDTAQLIKQVTIAMAAGVRAAAGISKQLCHEEGQRALKAEQSQA